MTTERQVYEIMRKKTDNPLSLNLAGNKLIFQDHRKWIIDSSDLDVAVSEIMELARENEVLKLQLSDVRMELTKSEQMKRASMNLLAEERKKNIILMQTLSLYKDELKKSFETIAELE